MGRKHLTKFRQALIRAVFGALVALFVGAGAVSAAVNLKNGNFYLVYTDLVLGDLEIGRTYNSKAARRGWFGVGWGCELETFLQITPSGNAVLNHNGSGRQDLFVRDSLTANDIDSSISDILVAAKIAGDVTTPDAAKVLRERLVEYSTRARIWERYYKRGLLPRVQLPVGAKLRMASQSGGDLLTRTPRGYLIERGVYLADSIPGDMEFDLEGRLVRIHQESNDLVLEYKQDGRIVEVRKGADTIRLLRDERGFVTAARAGDNWAEYRYDDRGALIFSIDADNNAYAFSYDDSFNLTRVLYTDDSTLEIGYTSVEKFTSKVEDRWGGVTEYRYGGDSPYHYWTEVHKTSFYAEEVRKSRYEYYIERDARGYQWTSGIITEINGTRTETRYNRAGKPILILSDQNRTEFKYDNKGRLLEKASSQGERLLLTYDEATGKLAESSRWRDGELRDRTLLTYDSRGRLARFDSLEEGVFTIQYDAHGNVELIQSSEVTVNLDYDAKGKLQGLALLGDEPGAIRRVADSEGSQSFESAGGPDEADRVLLTCIEIEMVLLPYIKLGWDL